MARKPKPSGRLNPGPFTTADVTKALRALGAAERTGGGHQRVYEHASGWKVPVSEGWTGLKKGCPILKGIARTTRVSDKELLRRLNGF